MTIDTIDRRSTIEAAYDAAEKEETPEVVENESTASAPTDKTVETSEPSPVENAEKPVEEPTETVEPTEPAEKAEKPLALDKAPQSWRGPQKAKWDKLDLDVRQEVVRRERDITRVMSETSQARQLAQQFNAAVQPFADHIASRGAQPLQAFTALLDADRTLSTAPPEQRAAFMAKLITDYKIDVEALDAALSKSGVIDPASSRIDSLLEQRLAPINQFLTRQQQQQAYEHQRQEQQTLQTIETMATDPKYPYFNDVREDMADIIDLQAKKGIYLTLEQAYNRATAMNPEVSQVISTQRANEAKTAAARAANAKAQQALSASKSVGGAPTGLSSGASGKLDRRAAIEAAFTAAEGR